MASQNDGTHLVKRKRTKRQRSSSPFLVANMTSSSSTTGDVDGIDRGVITAADYNSMASSSAPTTSSGGETYESTEEEEDMANCLIMLAQGGKIGNSSSIRKTVTEKISSRRFSTVVTSDTNRAGFYVYECKTCYRTFPSFQALGGHRASHKKPKSGVDENKSVTVLPPKEDCAGQEPQFLFSSNNNNKGGKIHECSICGSEFTSGQALGGHMRRHRATGAAVGNNPVVVVATTVESNNSTGGDDEVKPRRNILPLDLNLPAPEEDHPLPPPPPPHHHHHQHHDSGFQFGSTQQPLVFSAPTLVDCHY